MKDDFIQFLRDGRVRGLGLGSSKQEVESVFGVPGTSGSNPGAPNLSEAFYSGVSLWYDNDLVIAIGVPHQEDWCYHGRRWVIDWDEAFPGDHCLPNDFLELLDKHKVPYRLPSQSEVDIYNSICITAGLVSVGARKDVIPAPPDSEYLNHFTADKYVRAFLVSNEFRVL